MDLIILPEPAYHPFSAEYYLRDKYQFTDEEILSAVKNHTLGGENLPLLDQILFVSDFLGSDFAMRQIQYANWVWDCIKIEKSNGRVIRKESSNSPDDSRYLQSLCG